MTLEAGPDLDAEVATKVMGLQNVSLRQHAQGEALFGERDGLTEWVPAYSSDIAAAWQILEQPRWRIEIYRQPHMKGVTTVILNDGTNYGRGDADTAPLAICRAALASVTRYAPQCGTGLTSG